MRGSSSHPSLEGNVIFDKPLKTEWHGTQAGPSTERRWSLGGSRSIASTFPSRSKDHLGLRRRELVICGFIPESDNPYYEQSVGIRSGYRRLGIEF